MNTFWFTIAREDLLGTALLRLRQHDGGYSAPLAFCCAKECDFKLALVTGRADTVEWENAETRGYWLHGPLTLLRSLGFSKKDVEYAHVSLHRPGGFIQGSSDSRSGEAAQSS